MVIIIIITMPLMVLCFLTAGNVNIYLIACFHDCCGSIIEVSFQEKRIFACKLTPAVLLLAGYSQFLVYHLTVLYLVTLYDFQ